MPDWANSRKRCFFGQRAIEYLPTSHDAFDAPFFVVNMTEILTLAGQHDEAVTQLKFLLSVPGFVSVPYLRLDPMWRPLYSLPGFQELLEQDSTAVSGA